MNVKRTFGLAAPALLLAAPAAFAAVNYNGGTLSENFDTLSTTNVTPAFSATAGTQAGIPGLPTWQGAKIAGTNTTGLNFLADAGGSNSGALYSYGAVGSGERALGSLASGTNAGAFGVELVNNTSDTMMEITISFDREQYRSSTSTQNILAFAYGFSGGSIGAADFLSNAGMTLHTAGDAVGDAPVVANGQLNPPTVVLAVNFAITGLSWAPGQSLFIRWADFNDVGNDAGIAIDNFDFTARVPGPGSLALIGLAGIVAGRRRR